MTPNNTEPIVEPPVIPNNTVPNNTVPDIIIEPIVEPANNTNYTEPDIIIEPPVEPTPNTTVPDVIVEPPVEPTNTTNNTNYTEPVIPEPYIEPNITEPVYEPEVPSNNTNITEPIIEEPIITPNITEPEPVITPNITEPTPNITEPVITPNVTEPEEVEPELIPVPDGKTIDDVTGLGDTNQTKNDGFENKKYDVDIPPRNFENPEDIDKKYIKLIEEILYSPNAEAPLTFKTGPNGWRDVAFHPDGSIWGVGLDNSIWYCTYDCVNIDGTALYVSVDTDGTVYVVSPEKVIFRRNGPIGEWTIVETPAATVVDIATRAGFHFMITDDSDEGSDSYAVYGKRSSDASWSRVNGNMRYIATDNDGNVHGTGKLEGIWRRTKNNDLWK